MARGARLPISEPQRPFFLSSAPQKYQSAEAPEHPARAASKTTKKKPEGLSATPSPLHPTPHPHYPPHARILHVRAGGGDVDARSAVA